MYVIVYMYFIKVNKIHIACFKFAYFTPSFSLIYAEKFVFKGLGQSKT